MLTPIFNEPRDYAWGDLELIPRLQGREPSGTPEAEVWFGDHPAAPAILPDGRTLRDALVQRGAAPLPYLVKLLAAGKSLSIQAHPTRAQAQKGFAREEAAGIPRDADHRLYRDDNHKPEIIVALSHTFRALVGLRPIAETRALFATLEDGAGVQRMREMLALADESEAFLTTLRWALEEADDGAIAQVSVALERAGDALSSSNRQILHGVMTDFPGDPGILVAALMNPVILNRGEAVFAPAGVLHAYQYGLGIEVMAASDNVLRGGLTPKHIDVSELLHLLDPRSERPPLVAAQGDGSIVRYPVVIPDFAVARVDVAGEVLAIGVRAPTTVVATAGTVVVEEGAERVSLRAGEAALVLDANSIVLSGSGQVYVVEPGDG